MSQLPDCEHFETLDRLLGEALSLPADQREAWINEHCRDQPELRAELLDLLARLDDRDILDSLAEQVADATVDAQDMSGQRVGVWHLCRLLGTGGMGQVYFAEREDQDFRQSAAIKLMRPELSHPSLRERFVRERQILARLNDPRIARLLDGGETRDGRVWLAMEYIEGVPIDEYCSTRDLGLEQRLDLLEEVVAAVEHAHQHLIIHRDIKPGNVLVTPEGRVRLLDFGIAELVDENIDESGKQTVTRVLTPRYASPEQRAGRPATTASDIYQLGLLAFEMITGARAGEDLPRASTALHKHLTAAGAPAREIRARSRKLRGDIDHIIARATARDPRHRYPSCERFRADLHHHRTGWPVAARAGERWYRARRFLGRHSLVVGMVSVAVLASAFYLVLALQQARAIRAEADKATAVRDFVVELFRQADPGHTLGEDLPVREVLEQGRLHIEHTLREQPEIRVELLHTLGELYHALGEYTQAETLLEEAVELAVERKNHAAEFKTRLALAIVLWDGFSRYQAAEEQAGLALKRTSSERERALAEAELGYLALKRGLPERAEPMVNAALTRYQRLRPEQSSPLELARIMTFVAYTDLTLGNFDASEQHLENILAIYEGAVDPDYPEIQAVRYSLARLNLARGDWAQAEEQMRSVIASETRVLGADHHEVGVSRTGLARILFAQGRLEEAEREFSESLAILEQTSGESHFYIGDNLKGYAELALSLGRRDQAESYLRRSLEILEQILEPSDWRLADAYRIAAAAATADGNCADARRLLEDAREVMLAGPEPYPSRWRETWQSLENAEQSGCPTAD